uniref:Reverse transcriptase domain-containing protein n=1 Tax=Nicotiana tabacum TaxID=4097 RepID=A0A1S4DKM2_TOBAC|nr:PREDICTED: uncharacterized protein LOC107830795 [Nicotiana tabacum]
MADKFVMAHARAKKAEARVNDIFTIKKSLGKELRDFIAQFIRVRMTLPNISEGMTVAAFQNGLSRDGSRAIRKLLSRLMKYSPTTWDKIHNAYCAKVRADEDDLNGPTHRLTSIVYALEKLGQKMKWLPKIRSDLNTRKSDALYEFHQERGHKTEDCIALRQEAVNMLQQGHLKELLSNRGRTNFARERDQGPPKPPSPARTINMIIGGSDDASINNVKFTTTHKLKRSITREWYDELEESIIFDKSDADGLTFPQNDALIITLRILDTNVKCIMMDDRSVACIVHPRVLTQMRLEDNIVLRCIMLTGFNNAVERTSREITLTVLAGGVTQEKSFQIIDQATAYNAIVGRPWIHPMKVVPSSLYQEIKYPTPWGIFSIQGEQRTSRECYIIYLDGTTTHQRKDKEKRA